MYHRLSDLAAQRRISVNLGAFAIVHVFGSWALLMVSLRLVMDWLALPGAAAHTDVIRLFRPLLLSSLAPLGTGALYLSAAFGVLNARRWARVLGCTAALLDGILMVVAAPAVPEWMTIYGVFVAQGLIGVSRLVTLKAFARS